MKDYIRHIQRTDEPNKDKSWCGIDVGGIFSFVDIDHAVLTIEQEGRLVPCKKCTAKIKTLLNKI